MLLDTLTILLNLDTKSAEESINKLKESINGIAKVGSNIFQAFGLKKLLDSFVAVNANLNRLANTLGEDYDTIQLWGEAVKTMGGDVNSFNSSLVTINSNMEQFALTGNSSILPILNRLSIGFTNADGSLKKGTEILLELSNVLAQLPERRSFAYGKSLGLDTGTILLLRQGEEYITNIINKQRAYGIYTKEDGEITLRFKNTIDNLVQSLKSIFSLFARLTLPIISKFSSSLTKLILFIKSYDNFIKGFFIGLAIAISSSLIPSILKLTKSFLLLQKSTIIITSIATIVGLLLDDFLTWKNNGNALFATLYKGLDNLLNKLKLFKEYLSNNIFNYISNMFNKFKDIVAKPFKFLINSKEERDVNVNSSSMIPLLYSPNPKWKSSSNNISNNTNNNSSTINISNIDINTKATDAKSIVDSFFSEMQKRNIIMNQNNYYGLY